MIFVLAGALAACAPPKPVNVVLGEACERCRRPIVQERLAGEHIAANGFAVKFRTIHCMSTWLAQHPGTADDYLFVANYAKGGWVRADRASYVRVIVDRNTMARDFVAFADAGSAAGAAREHGSAVVGWDAVLDLGRAEPMGGN
jgi:hypothetical protein